MKKTQEKWVVMGQGSNDSQRGGGKRGFSPDVKNTQRGCCPSHGDPRRERQVVQDQLHWSHGLTLPS